MHVFSFMAPISCEYFPASPTKLVLVCESESTFICGTFLSSLTCAFVSRCLCSGKLEDFKKGLDSYLGMPSFNVKAQMQREHCSSYDSHTKFHPPNNKDIETTPEIEWRYVVEYDATKDWPGADDREGTNSQTSALQKLYISTLGH